MIKAVRSQRAVRTRGGRHQTYIHESWMSEWLYRVRNYGSAEAQGRYSVCSKYHGFLLSSYVLYGGARHVHAMLRAS